MYCDVCGRINGHHPKCPEYDRRVSKRTLECCVCGEDISINDEYITNDDGDSRHIECYTGMRELLSWLGYEVKIMEEKDERDY